MASAGDETSERRRKRPWRKPREAPGPLLLLREGGADQAAGRVSGGVGRVEEPAGDHVPTAEDGVVNIDGSIMEGVSMHRSASHHACKG